MRAVGLAATTTRFSMLRQGVTRLAQSSNTKTCTSSSNTNSGNAMNKRTRTRSLGRVRSVASARELVSSVSEEEGYEQHSEDSEAEDGPPGKRRRTMNNAGKNKSIKKTAPKKTASLKLYARLFQPGLAQDHEACEMPSRLHKFTYHRPRLLGRKESTTARYGQDALLRWFDSVNTSRAMPWRKPWIDSQSVSDGQECRKDLERRAYEVWISEIMLQQTRVAVVIDYWNRWMDKWPTIQDLAAADGQDVLAAWRGLGYYSRATRIHEAAKLVVADPVMDGLLPEDVHVLEARVPGIGRYTAGAISAIVFGRAEALVDGNVLRVLSRQLGLLANVKTDKITIDLLWAAADSLVKDVAGEQVLGKSDRPGRWGQALMELGSTVCTPKPNCADCPISSTCRVYQEGQQLASKETKPRKVKRDAAIDMEDICNICVPLGETFDDDETSGATNRTNDKPTKTDSKQSKLSAFFNVDPKPGKTKGTVPETAALGNIINHARKFPLKIPKKAVREEETLVCAIRRKDGQFLLHRRPDKGLLAGLWEFPSQTADLAGELESKTRIQLAKDYVSQLGFKTKHLGELGSVPWLFSHLKLTMHVHLFTTDSDSDEDTSDGASKPDDRSRWSDDVENASMGTGMRKCWFLVQQAVV